MQVAIAMLACVLVLLPSAAWPAPPGMDLAQAYRLALEQDAALRAARAAAQVRRERLPQARAQLLPNVGAQLTKFRNDLTSTFPGPDAVSITTRDEYGSYAHSLTVRQQIFRPYHWADKRQAEAQVAEAEATLDSEMQSLAVRLVTVYLQALAAEDEVALVLTQKSAYATQVQAARRRLSAGSGTRTDIDEAQARFDMAVARELAARQNVGYTRQHLHALTGPAADVLARVAPERLPLVSPDPRELQAWTERSERYSPQMRALVAQVEGARHEVDKAQAAHLPTLDAVAAYSVSYADNVTRLNTKFDQKAIGLQLNVPIFSSGYASSRVRQAHADLERISEVLEVARRELGLRVYKEFRGVSEGVLRVRALEQAVRSAETLVASTRRSYEAGSRTQVDVLNAEEQRVTAMRDLEEARYQYLLARITLRALAGDADMAAIEELNGWLQP